MAKPKVNVPILVAGLLLVVPLVALLYSGFGKNPNARPSALVGTVAKDFTLVDLDGNPVSLSDFEGEPVVLNFWSTWCGPCKYEHPLLLDAAKQVPEVHFFGVIYSDEPAKIRQYLRREGQAYPHLVDPGNRVAIDYGVTGVPETFFIDRSGTIVHKEAGQLHPYVLRDMLTEVRK